MKRVVSGTVDEYLHFVAVYSTDYTTPLTGLSSNWTVVYCRNGGADTTFTTPTIAEIDATTMPGAYSLLLDEGVTVTGGNVSEEVLIYITHAGMAPVRLTYEIFVP